jgi:protein-tyrosine phosphatase
VNVRSLLPAWLRSVLRTAVSRTYRQDVLRERRRRRAGEPALPAGPVRRVMVVCQGNICRSPFAERHLAGLCPGIEVRSSGLRTRGGDPAQPGALRVGRELGTDLSDHVSQRLDTDDVAWADLIIGMQGWHEAEVLARHPTSRGKVLLLGDFLPAAPHLIADPWGHDDDFFRTVFERIVTANERLCRILTPDGSA